MSLNGKVNDANKDRALVLRGMPYRVKLDEIIEFFEGYGKLRELFHGGDRRDEIHAET